MFVNRMPRYEILSEDAMATLETGSRSASASAAKLLVSRVTR